MLEPYVPGRWVYRSLSVNYRTPAEIMTVAAAVLAEFAPDVVHVVTPSMLGLYGVHYAKRRGEPGAPEIPCRALPMCAAE